MQSEKKTAFITGITGQDGAYLARFLLDRGDYYIVGLRQPVAFPDTDNLDALIPDWREQEDFSLEYGDMTDAGSLLRIIREYQPDEIYNFAAQTQVHISFAAPEMTSQINGVGFVRLLDSVRSLGMEKRVKIFQSSTSELFGATPAPQNETSFMVPQSPYAVAKFYAYHMARVYRDAYGMFVANGIMFNHESPLRGEQFVTRKIAMAVAALRAGVQDCLMLGNLDARRDWSHAADMMRGAWMILQHDRADDFVLASGVSASVRDFVDLAFSHAGLSLDWRGTGREEVGIDQASGQIMVRVDPALFRPLDVDDLCGVSDKARSVLGWMPDYSLTDMVAEMADAELRYFPVAKSSKIYA